MIKGITRIFSGMAAVLAVTMLLGANPASATTITECHNLIDVVRTTLAGADIGGGHPDRTRASLNSKLDGADTKLEEGKFDDALQKLTDFRGKIEELLYARKPKINAGDAWLLIDAVDDAIDCVKDLGY